MGIGNVTWYQPFAPVEQLNAGLAVRHGRCAGADAADTIGATAGDDSVTGTNAIARAGTLDDGARPADSANHAAGNDRMALRAFRCRRSRSKQPD
jgi:hypothetical protein